MKKIIIIINANFYEWDVTFILMSETIKKGDIDYD